MCLQLPFNLAAICFLGGVQFYAHWSTSPQYASHLPDYNATIAPCLRSAASGSCAQDGDTAVAVLQAVAQGISEVWIVSNVWSGVIILVGVALCSPRAALFAVLGSLIGLLTALVLAVDGYDAWLGLWGYNSVLSAIAVGGGVFAKPTWRASITREALGQETRVVFADYRVDMAEHPGLYPGSSKARRNCATCGSPAAAPGRTMPAATWVSLGAV